MVLGTGRAAFEVRAHARNLLVCGGARELELDVGIVAQFHKCFWLPNPGGALRAPPGGR